MTKEGEDMESKRPATDRTGTIGIIGAGNIGQALARTALRAGREVVIANSRGPESLAPVVADLEKIAGRIDAVGDPLHAALPGQDHSNLTTDRVAALCVRRGQRGVIAGLRFPSAIKELKCGEHGGNDGCTRWQHAPELASGDGK